MAAALEELRRVLVGPDGKAIDPVTADWGTIEKGAILLLKGAFTPENPRHLEVLFMLSSALGERLRAAHGAFWFQNRSNPHGATMGFPEALVVFSPIETVLQALGRARLGTLDSVPVELGKALAQSRGEGSGGRRLGPAEYQHLFDPGLVQLLALEPATLQRTLGTTADEIVRDFDHGFSKLSREIPEEARTHVTREIGGALKRLPGGEALGSQIARAPQLIELVTLATSVTATTGIAPLEFWEQLLVPLLHVGAADSFAELDEEELAAYKQGADPLLIYVDVVPYKIPAADEDGLLGVFPPAGVKLIDPRFSEGQAARILQLDVEVLRPLLADFDPAAVRASIERFAVACAQAAGEDSPAAPPADRPNLREMVLHLAEDLKRLIATIDEQKLVLALRYVTESEASSEGMLQDLRRALKAPRIVLA
jgi:hypothetical protein